MEQTRLVNLPIIGRVQHGEKIKNKVTEYGYFIAKIQDEFMKTYLEKFDELFKGKKSIDIEFFDENPLSMKYARFNQSGEACSCRIDSNNAKLKVKNGWQDIKCDLFNCQYRQKNESGKRACNRIGWLKFIIPSICRDRIWLMRITGQTSLDRLDDYFILQKSQGISIKGNYTLFLKQEEQSNSQGQTFNNYILDILKKEDFISNKQISENNPKQENLSTKKAQHVNNNVVKEQEKEPLEPAIAQNEKETQQLENASVKEQPSEKETELKAKKQAKGKSKKSEETSAEVIPIEKAEKIDEFQNHYIFDTLSSEIITTKNGNSKEYSVGTFYDIHDRVHKIIVKEEYVAELQNCELGTLVEIRNIKEVDGKKFALDLTFIQKMQKNIAA